MDLRLAEAHLRIHYAQCYETLQTALDKMIGSLRTVLLNQSRYPIAAVTGRIKHVDSAAEKLVRKYTDRIQDCKSTDDLVALITDLLGIRVVCYYEDHIRPISELIAQQYDVRRETDKIDEITMAGRFGYRALHLDLRLDSTRGSLVDFSELAGLTFEIQIRSVVQDAWSTLDHSVKYKRNLPENLGRRVIRLAALAELMDSEFIQIREEVAGSLSEEQDVQDDVVDVITFANIVQGSSIGARITPHRIDVLFDELMRSGLGIRRSVLESIVGPNGALKQLTEAADRAGLAIQEVQLVRAAIWWTDRRYEFLVESALRARLEKIVRGVGP